jgi:Reverse transcriptase (RNA-dependent DNA polymerase)
MTLNANSENSNRGGEPSLESPDLAQPLGCEIVSSIDIFLLLEMLNTGESFSEVRAERYLELLRDPRNPDELLPILTSAMIPKGTGLRKINFVANDNNLERHLPSGLPTYLYKQIFHKYQIRQVLDVLYPITKDFVHPQSYGYGPGRDNIEAAFQIKQWIDEGFVHILLIDFLECFKHVDLEQLDREVLMPLLHEHTELQELILKLQEIPSCNRNGSIERGSGLTQGLSPSMHLLNLFLRYCDGFCFSLSPHYIRLHDDLVLCFRTEAEAREAYGRFLCYRETSYSSMPLHPNKTRITTSANLEFGGYAFRIEEGRNQITLSDKAKLKAKEKYGNLAQLLQEGITLQPNMPLEEVRLRVKQMIKSTQRQLSIVEDLRIRTELWQYIGRVLKTAFCRRFPRAKQQERQLRNLLDNKEKKDIQNLVRGVSQADSIEPFSTSDLGLIIYHAW